MISIIVIMPSLYHSTTVISIGGMKRQVWELKLWLEEEYGTESPLAIAITSEFAALAEWHWMSALKRPGVKNSTEHSWNTFSPLPSNGISML